MALFLGSVLRMTFDEMLMNTTECGHGDDGVSIGGNSAVVRILNNFPQSTS